jgi:L-Ala-D/L-Glu epimerase
VVAIKVTAESFPIAGTFTIARGSKTAADVVHVALRDGDAVGQAECVPYARYHETVAQCVAALEAVPTCIKHEDVPHLGLPHAAANALDCAFWDLKAKIIDKPVWQLAGLATPVAKVTAYTLSLDTPEAMAATALKAAQHPLLKLKLGREGDEQRLAAIRAAVPKARLIVDANEGWRESNIEAMLACCVAYGVELVEQPLPQGEDDILSRITSPVLICADESAHDTSSLASLIGKYGAVNIKLDKTGGLTEALAMAKEAREQGFKIMVGCMLATSLGMAPAFLVAQLADYVDLDGPLLLAKDRVPAINYEKDLMQPPPRELWG